MFHSGSLLARKLRILCKWFFGVLFFLLIAAYVLVPEMVVAGPTEIRSPSKLCKGHQMLPEVCFVSGLPEKEYRLWQFTIPFPFFSHKKRPDSPAITNEEMAVFFGRLMSIITEYTSSYTLQFSIIK